MRRLRPSFAAIILTLLFCISSHDAVAQKHLNDIFSVVTNNREDKIQGETDDYYYWLEYVYSNVANQNIFEPKKLPLLQHAANIIGLNNL
jgi:hypothetical protein